MSQSAGFIVSVEDITDFYAIKRYIQGLEYSRLIYCRIDANQHLYITTQEQLEKGDNK